MKSLFTLKSPFGPQSGTLPGKNVLFLRQVDGDILKSEKSNDPWTPLVQGSLFVNKRSLSLVTQEKLGEDVTFWAVVCVCSYDESCIYDNKYCLSDNHFCLNSSQLMQVIVFQEAILQNKLLTCVPTVWFQGPINKLTEWNALEFIDLCSRISNFIS